MGKAPAFISAIASTARSPTRDNSKKRKEVGTIVPNAPGPKKVKDSVAGGASGSVSTHEGTKSTSELDLPSGLKEGALWDVGVRDDLRAVIKPPPKFFKPQLLTEQDAVDLAEMERQTIKAASMLKTYASVALDLSALETKYLALQEEHGRVKGELTASVEAGKNFEAELRKTQAELSQSQTQVEKARKVMQTAKAATLKQDEDIKRLRSSRDELLDQLKTGVEVSFNNALAQVKFLNPGVELSLESAHYLSYIDDDNVLVPPPVLPDSNADSSPETLAAVSSGDSAGSLGVARENPEN